YLWKAAASEAAAAAAAAQPPPMWAVEAATVTSRPFARSTTSIGTVRALQSITLRNELPGTVHKVSLQTGQVVEAGAVLVELDVAVETAELQALEAEAKLAASMLARMEQALAKQGASAADVDRARAEHDKALANVTRTKAVIERKRLRAPFRARVGFVDLHVGQYLDAGATVTTLQGTEDAVHVDYAVTQDVAARLTVGSEVEVTVTGQATARATIVAMDARVDAATRNTSVRALLRGLSPMPQPGASVRVRTPIEAPSEVLVVPVTALRRGPDGDYVYAIVKNAQGALVPEFRKVTSGNTLGDEVVIKIGLKLGEQIVAAGSFKPITSGVLTIVDKTPTGQQADAPKGTQPAAGESTAKPQ
ncbi:MAG: efflux RND transporter periplasmic adaptor subunit, partial [Planctomycetes bacterium]|nr:efflux RND transporter periplasmic adaptor subunit [Planctomycetota bacterium]